MKQTEECLFSGSYLYQKHLLFHSTTNNKVMKEEQQHRRQQEETENDWMEPQRLSEIIRNYQNKIVSEINGRLRLGRDKTMLLEAVMFKQIEDFFSENVSIHKFSI